MSYLNKAFLLIVLLLVIGCSSGRRTVSINSTRPADISVSQSVQNLLILNRTNYSKSIIGTIEGILTGELPQEDKAAVQAFIGGLNRRLGVSGRYATSVASEILDGNSVTAAFPDQLAWSEIENLCRQYNTDAVLAIELFDSDFIITDGKRNKETKNEDGEKILVPEFYASGVANITLGVRFYHPQIREIVDQKRYTRTKTWEAAAATKADALAALISKGNASRNLAQILGSNYAFRIAPMPIRITRSFTGKSKKAPALERGSRFADVGNWESAINAWKEGLPGAPTKEAGIMAYNIAIGYEILGQIDNAQQWAEKSYTQYGYKEARNYINDLNTKINNESIANDQLGN